MAGDDLELKFRLYEALLKKYKDLINDTERKTVGEIKGLVNADDLTIQSFVSRFKPEDYAFEKDFLGTLEKCYNAVTKDISFTKAGIDLNFWLSPEEILKYKVADDEDISVFLCSVLQALGEETAEVLICEMENFSTHAMAIANSQRRFILLDASQKTPFQEFIGSQEDVLQKYTFQGQRIKKPLYKFNHQNYEQFME